MAAKIDLMLKDMSALTATRLERHRDVIIRLARLETISATDDVPVGAIQGVIDETTIVLPIADVVDLAQERVRLEKDLGKLNGAISKLDKKLSNESFISALRRKWSRKTVNVWLMRRPGGTSLLPRWNVSLRFSVFAF